MFHSELKDFIQSKRVYFNSLPTNQLNFPTWDHMVDYYDESFLSGNKRARDPHKIFVNVLPGEVPMVDDLTKELQQFLNVEHVSCHNYAGFSPNAKASPVHQDAMDVLFVMAKGTMPWRVFENGYDDDKKEGKSTFSRRLVPGDYIYVPAGVYHAAYPDRSRVGFSFGWREAPFK